MDPPETDALQTTLRLLAAVGRDDRAAVEELFERYAPRVRRIVALRMGRPIHRLAEVDDLVQDTLLSVFQSLGGFTPRSVGAFRSYLATCALNKIRDALRWRSTQKSEYGKVRPLGEIEDEGLSSSIFAGREPSPSEQAMGRELEERVEKALLSMSERYREVIILRQLCELTDEEVAAELGLGSTANVRTVCHRALKKLRDLLGAGSG